MCQRQQRSTHTHARTHACTHTHAHTHTHTRARTHRERGWRRTSRCSCARPRATPQRSAATAQPPRVAQPLSASSTATGRIQMPAARRTATPRTPPAACPLPLPLPPILAAAGRPSARHRHRHGVGSLLWASTSFCLFRPSRTRRATADLSNLPWMGGEGLGSTWALTEDPEALAGLLSSPPIDSRSRQFLECQFPLAQATLNLLLACSCPRSSYHRSLRGSEAPTASKGWVGDRSTERAHARM